MQYNPVNESCHVYLLLLQVIPVHTGCAHQ
jgi:hypothetical protein